jgi:hypothetical protein
VGLLTLIRRSTPLAAAPAVDVSALPDATLTPRERAWSTLWYLENHPDQWDQRTFGRFVSGQRVETVGCFAHHLCKAAGYETFGCFATAVADEFKLSTFYRCGSTHGDQGCRMADHVQTEDGWDLVPNVAARLLGADKADLYDFKTPIGSMFGAGSSIRQLRHTLPKLVGPEPKNNR